MKNPESKLSQRKNEHYSLALKFWQDRYKNNDFNQSIFERKLETNEFVDFGLGDLDLSIDLFNYHFTTPFYIEAMTGGSQITAKINQQLSAIANRTKIAMAVGSQSIALKDSQQVESFKVVRKNNPDGFIFANIGAGHNLQSALQAIEMIEANALEIHINLIQELIMEDGDRDFKNWQENILKIIDGSPVPVIVKGVGFGMSKSTIQEIVKLKPAAINLSGNSGTNFAWIEAKRNPNINWQVDSFAGNFPSYSTETSLINAEKIANQLPLISNGGFSNPNDIVIAQSYGAKLVGIAGYFLFLNSINQLEQTISEWQEILPKLYLLYGAKNQSELIENLNPLGK